MIISSPREAPTCPGIGHVLQLSCPDRPGIVHAVAQFITEHSGNIVESQQFDSRQSGLFFLRATFETSAEGTPAIGELRGNFEDVAARFDMTWELRPADERQSLLIMVSKHAHCLNDLLFKASTGWLNVDVRAVVSNHPDLGRLADGYDVPFHHVPVTAASKPQAEARLLQLVDALDVDLVVLARYMQILSDGLCTELYGRAINIHHSMLPAFKGARPYNQAHERGVKLIGATAHYVTADLDEGPIIEQEVARVDHSLNAEEVSRLGRDTECLALARAVRWHTESRVMIEGHRTVVFR